MKKFDYDEWRRGMPWAIDFSIYIGDADMSEEDIEHYEQALSDALTTNGNFGVVQAEESTIDIYGNNLGDNKRFVELLNEMCKRYNVWLEREFEDEKGNVELCEISVADLEVLLNRLHIA